MSEFIPGDFWEKRLNENSGLEGVGYEKLGRPFNIWAYRIRKVAFLNLLQSQAVDPRGKCVLDIGSGTGFYLDIWKQLGASRDFGADITEVSVQNLQKRFPDCTVVRLDIGEPLPDNHPWIGTFDLISCMDVLFHIVDLKYCELIINHLVDFLDHIIFYQIYKCHHFYLQRMTLKFAQAYIYYMNI